MEALTPLLLRNAADSGDSPFVIDATGSREVSHGELMRLVKEWEIAHAHLPQHSRVAIALRNPVDMVISLVSVMASGRWAVPLDPNLGDSLLSRAADLGAISLLRDGGEVSLTPSSQQENRGGGIVLASSGTTGTPKIMCLSIALLLGVARNVVSHHELTPSDRCFNPLPLFHINAEVVAVLSSVVVGASLVVEDKFHRTDFWKKVGATKATWINAVPAIVHRLLPLRDGEVLPSGIRFVRSASAPLPAALLQNFEMETAIPIVESYGMTEAGSQICANPVSGVRKAGSVGIPVGVHLEIRRVDGSIAKAGEVGAVWISGDTVISRYESPGYDDRFSDEWLRTGDVGYQDDDGYVFLTGRSDDVINRGGEKIMPREIEEAVLQVTGVAGVAVVGESDDVFSQVPVVWVELENEEVVPSIVDVLTTQFPRTRRPARLYVVPALPRHATGKIQKNPLREGSVRPDLTLDLP